MTDILRTLHDELNEAESEYDKLYMQLTILQSDVRRADNLVRIRRQRLLFMLIAKVDGSNDKLP